MRVGIAEKVFEVRG